MKFNIPKLIKKSKKTEKHENEFENIIEFAKVLIKAPTEEGGTRPIFNLIKLMIDNILYEKLNNVVNEVVYSDNREFYQILDCLSNEINKKNKKSNSVKENFAYNQKSSVKIKLGQDPVISFPYKKNKIEDMLLTVGTENNRWEQQKYLHYFDLFLPIGLTVIKTNGNHSVATGIVKSVGELVVDGSEDRAIYDISRAYNLVRFDGKKFINTLTGEVVYECITKEYGYIYEIGRIIEKENISFVFGKEF